LVPKTGAGTWNAAQHGPGRLDPERLALRVLRSIPLLLLLITAQVAQAAASGEDEPGKQLFTNGTTPRCGICHTLHDAGASGAVAPSLDELKPDAERVAKAIKNGIGQMPAYSNLTEQEIRAIAQYVARATGAAK
jgi:mono/diheme cytochrome c family protein